MIFCPFFNLLIPTFYSLLREKKNIRKCCVRFIFWLAKMKDILLIFMLDVYFWRSLYKTVYMLISLFSCAKLFIRSIFANMQTNCRNTITPIAIMWQYHHDYLMCVCLQHTIILVFFFLSLSRSLSLSFSPSVLLTFLPTSILPINKFILCNWYTKKKNKWKENHSIRYVLYVCVCLCGCVYSPQLLHYAQ